MKSNIPTDDEARAFERFHSFRNGWTDGAKGAPKQEKFAKHATRPDIASQYEKGYEAGRTARDDAMRTAAAEVGYVANILRAAS